jgi:hypothetical protein
MNENLSHQSPDRSEKASPERKLEVLLNELEALNGPSHEHLPQDLIAAQVERKQKEIAELKKEYPQLNN